MKLSGAKPQPTSYTYTAEQIKKFDVAIKDNASGMYHFGLINITVPNSEFSKEEKITQSMNLKMALGDFSKIKGATFRRNVDIMIMNEFYVHEPLVIFFGLTGKLREKWAYIPEGKTMEHVHLEMDGFQASVPYTIHHESDFIYTVERGNLEVDEVKFDDALFNLKSETILKKNKDEYFDEDDEICFEI